MCQGLGRGPAVARPSSGPGDEGAARLPPTSPAKLAAGADPPLGMAAITRAPEREGGHRKARSTKTAPGKKVVDHPRPVRSGRAPRIRGPKLGQGSRAELVGWKDDAVRPAQGSTSGTSSIGIARAIAAGAPWHHPCTRSNWPAGFKGQARTEGGARAKVKIGSPLLVRLAIVRRSKGGAAVRRATGENFAPGLGDYASLTRSGARQGEKLGDSSRTKGFARKA